MKNKILPVGMSLALAGGKAGIDRSMRKVTADMASYHKQITIVAASAPTQIGDWIGQDVPQPQSAINLLRPNVIVSKRYVNYVTGEAVNFLLVDCTDARDLLGHYPPVCYPNQGYILMSSQSHDWQVGDLVLTGMQYDFYKKDYDLVTKESQETNETVANFMLLPARSYWP